MIGNLDKNISIGPDSNEVQPQCKKIQDYIYRFSDQIGMGNFSKVFKGIHQTNNKQVAIKIIQLNSLTNNRLQQLLNTETKILKMLSHPNVIGCEQILSSIRNCYIITELCNGGDLQKKLKKVGNFKQKEIYQIVVDVYEGLKYLAKKHIVHRDIKVSNIFINNGVHKIADFGFAQISQTQFKDISVGSPIYMSPEGYINNMYGPKTDVWAFGVLLYELVQGKTPCFDCRTEADLKNHLLKQVDHNRFSSQISSDLKNLIIQCLQVNPSLRISALQIQNTAWMRKAVKIASDNFKNLEKQNLNQPRYVGISHGYRKTSEQLNSKLQTSPLSGGQDSFLKNYMQKFNNFLKIQVKQPEKSKQSDKQQFDHRRKHSTLDKTVRGSKDDSMQHKNNQSGKVFYSPKNAMHKFQKVVGFRSINPQTAQDKDKYQSFNNKGNISTPDNGHVKPNNFHHKNQTSKKQYCKQENGVFKNKSTWIDKTSSKQSNFEKNDKPVIEKQKNYGVCGNNNTTETRQEKQHKQPSYNFNSQQTKLGLASPSNNLYNINQNYSKNSPKANEQGIGALRQKLFEFYDINKISNQIKSNLKQDSNQKNQNHNHKSGKGVPGLKIDRHQKKSSQLTKIINRKLKFADCIGLIHYCRLCYKFACLLDQTGDSQQPKQFLINWSIQLLKQINHKIQQTDILFVNDNCLINNLSANPGQIEKKKKLKDVTEQYLTKYTNLIKTTNRVTMSLKQASSYIYNLYLLKGHEFKERAKDKKPYLYFALISYISVLDKETRNFAQFTYQIKNTFECRQAEKVLNIKISQFSRKIVQQITCESNEKEVRD